MIKNLSQFKKSIALKTPYIVVNHWRAEEIGTERIPTHIQTNGWYATCPTVEKIAKANGGRGYWLDYGKASDWTFHSNGDIERNGIFTIRFV